MPSHSIKSSICVINTKQTSCLFSSVSCVFCFYVAASSRSVTSSIKQIESEFYNVHFFMAGGIVMSVKKSFINKYMKR